MTLRVPGKLEREFRERAKSSYPLETYCYCLGTVAGDHVQIDELWWPDEVERHCTGSSVDVQPHWIVDASEHALETGLSVVGDAHSHISRDDVDADRSLSEVDHDYSDHLPVAGVCLVERVHRGGRTTMRASLRWWAPPPPITVKRI